MSVEYRAVVSCGWVVSSDEVRQLDDDIYDELTSNYMLVCQDGRAASVARDGSGILIEKTDIWRG